MNKEYQLSVWRDSLVEGDGVPDYYDEELIAIIGTQDMTSGCNASNINLVKSINNANTLTFDMYEQYYDSEFDAYMRNSYFDLIANETHLKLKYNNEWYDFVVKERNETSEEFKYSISATDYFVNELSKNGYNLEFSTDLGNNVGTVEELGEKIVDGTDWKIDDSDDTLKQLIEEPIYWVQYVGSDDLTIYKSIWNEEEPQPTETIETNDYLYLFYSSVNNRDPYLQILYKKKAQNENDFEVNTNGIIINCEDLNYYTTFDWKDKEDKTKKENRFQQTIEGTPITTIDQFKVSTTHKGERFAHTPLTEYDKFNNRVVDVYEKNPQQGEEGEKYYCTTETQYLAKDFNFVQNIISNNSNFASDDEWFGIGDAKVNAELTPTFEDWIKNTPKGKVDEWNSTNILKLDFSQVGENSYIYNTSIDDDPSRFFDILNNDGITTTYASIPSDTKYIARYKKHADSTGIINTININYKDSEVPLISFGFTDQNEGWIRAESKNSSEIRYNSEKEIQIQIEGTGIVLLTEIQLYKYYEFGGKEIAPGEVPDTSVDNMIVTKYNFYKPGSSEVISQMNEDGFTRQYDEKFKKVRTIEGRETNRFDLIQTLNESFECWNHFIIEREENGKIKLEEKYFLTKDVEVDKSKTYYTYEESTYKQITNVSIDDFYEEVIDGDSFKESNQYYIKNADIYKDNNYYPIYIDEDNFENYKSNLYVRKNIYEKRRVKDKSIKFTKDLGIEKSVGFYYDLNLNSVERNIESNEIITKLIVPDNNNEFGTNGVCSIARAKENLPKSNFIYSFDYYIKQGILDNARVRQDLDDGYLKEYANINNQLISLSNEMTEKEISFSSVSATYITNQEIFEKAEREILRLDKELGIYTNNVSYSLLPPEDKTWEVYFKDHDDINIKKKLAAIKEQEKLKEAADAELKSSSYHNLKEEIEQLNSKIARLENQLKALDTDFYNKYAQYIQEGTWQSEDYYDDNLYYYDALSSMYISKYPKVSYTINAADIKQAIDEESGYYDIFDFNVGDSTFVEDPDMFNNSTHRENVVITEISVNLNDPSQNTITVQNYRTEFSDLFQKFAAAATQIEYKGGAYDRASDVVQPDGTIRTDFLNNTLKSGNITIGGKDNSLTWSGASIISWNNNNNHILKMVGGGLVFSKDGGAHWNVGINGDGINADNIYAGKINVDNVLIGPESQPSFRWDSSGINAFSYEGDNTNFTKFVRLDRFGLYGVDGDQWFVPEEINEIEDEAQFGFIWDKFFLKSDYNNGLVRISSEDDIQILIKKYIKTSDTSIDPTKQYYIQDEFGQYHKIRNPQIEDITKYYEKEENERIKLGSLNDEHTLYGLRIKGADNTDALRADSDGNITITGTIFANAGKIAGFNIEGDVLYNVTLDEEGEPTIQNSGVVISPEGIGLGKKKLEDRTLSIEDRQFFVTDEGFLQAQNANILGTLTTSVFEKATTRAVGGASIFKNAQIIDNERTQLTADITTTIYLMNDNGYNDFNKGDYVAIIGSQQKDSERISGNTGTEYYYKIKDINKYERTKDTEIIKDKDYYIYNETADKYEKVNNPIEDDLGNYYEKIKCIILEWAYQDEYNEDWEYLLVQLATQDSNYQKTKDIKIDNTKDYYTYNDETKEYEKVDVPKQEDINNYYEEISFKDWLIGINSNAEWRPYNLTPNSLSFSTMKKAADVDHKLELTNKIVLGDLSSFTGPKEQGITSGLYAEGAYLTGSLYTGGDIIGASFTTKNGENKETNTWQGFTVDGNANLILGQIDLLKDKYTKESLKQGIIWNQNKAELYLQASGLEIGGLKYDEHFGFYPEHTPYPPSDYDKALPQMRDHKSNPNWNWPKEEPWKDWIEEGNSLIITNKTTKTIIGSGKFDIKTITGSTLELLDGGNYSEEHIVHMDTDGAQAKKFNGWESMEIGTNISNSLYKGERKGKWAFRVHDAGGKNNLYLKWLG